MSRRAAIWRILETDTRAVEAGTASICIAMAVSVLHTGSSWLPPPYMPAAWLALSTFHLWTATTRYCRLRQIMSAVSVVVFALVGWAMLWDHGLAGRPGVAALIVATGIQCWVYMALEAACVDHRREGEVCP